MMIQDSHITTGLHCGICIALWCPELHTIIFDQKESATHVLLVTYYGFGHTKTISQPVLATK